jgi:SP family general alpha glucoside:H+ symporter-like MFS transporter
MQIAGLPTVQSFNLSLAALALGLIGTALSWALMQHFGRRTIHLTGTITLFALLVLAGTCSFAHTRASNWAIGGLLTAFVLVYDLTIGPVTYTLIAELSSTLLKAQTIVLARAAFDASNIMVNVLTNYQLGEQNWDWGARTAFF